MRRRPRLRQLFRRQDGRCYLCGGEMTLATGQANTATIDHRLPRSRFRCGDPQSARENVAAVCHACNQAKGALTDAEYLAGMAAAAGATVTFAKRDGKARQLAEMQAAADAYGGAG